MCSKLNELVIIALQVSSSRHFDINYLDCIYLEFFQVYDSLTQFLYCWSEGVSDETTKDKGKKKRTKLRME